MSQLREGATEGSGISSHLYTPIVDEEDEDDNEGEEEVAASMTRLRI